LQIIDLERPGALLGTAGSIEGNIGEISHEARDIVKCCDIVFLELLSFHD
jgi:hypothetical protein